MKKHFVFFLLASLIAGVTQAQTNNWVGNFGSGWTINGNWALGHVPTATEDVVISTNGNSPSVQSGDIVSVRNLTLATGRLIYVSGALNVTGNMINNGTILIDNNNSSGLVQGSGSNYTGTGKVIFLFYDNNPDDGYRDVCFPIAGTVNDLETNVGFPVSGANGVQCWYSYSPYPNVQVYNEALSIVDGAFNEGWLSYTGSTNPFTPMKGLAVRQESGVGLTYFYIEGVPNNGTQSIAITHTASPANVAEEGWNLVGNPYPSSINWPAVAALNPTITGSCYVFHSTGQFTGTWGTVNAVGVTTGGLTENLPAGQGFFVKAQSSGSFVMDNSVRSTAAVAFYKTGALDNEIRLTLTGEGNSDEIVAYTDAAATHGYDAQHDAVKMAAGSTISIGFLQAGEEYAINAINSITEETELALALQVTNDGYYTIAASTLNTGLKAYLKDKLTNTLYDLSLATPAVIINGGPKSIGRFSIVFKSSMATGVEDMINKSTEIFANGNHVFVRRQSLTPAQINITNVLGQPLMEVNTVATSEQLYLPLAATGYAIVKVTEGDKVSVSKVLITNKN